MTNNYLYEATIKNEETGEVLVKVFSYSHEGLKEEMGKRKWTAAVEKTNEITEPDFNEDDNEVAKGQDLAAEES